MTGRGKSKIIVLMPMILCFFCTIFLSKVWFYQYQQVAFETISKFSEVLTEQNPKMEQEVLSALKDYEKLTVQEEKGLYFLEKYGYERGEFSKDLGGRMFVFSIVLFFIVGISFLLSIKYEERRVKGRIRELTKYLEQVNLGDDGTIIQMKEDEFAHLQDEIYKTVTSLYQTRDTAVEAKKNFADNLANIAHQLKTPITGALLSLQLIKKENLQLYKKQIQTQLNRLNYLEESLLTLSKIDAGTLQLDREKVDVYTALTLAAENINPLLEKARVQVEIPEKEYVEFIGDLEWTMEAFMNVMKNCIEHSPKGGYIHCDYFNNPLYATILIYDEGEGFSIKDLPHLFERFYQGENKGMKDREGIGIGLSLARSIFELQNGNITAKNLPNGGACFEIRIYHSH